MPTEEMAESATHIVFCTEDGATSLRFPAIVATYIARTATVINLVYEIEELYMVAMESFQDFSLEILALSDQVRFALRTEEEYHFKECLRVNRSLASLFTVLRMYSDTVKKMFSDPENRVRRLFSLSGYWELDSLRNYVQHVSFLPLRRSLTCTLCDPDTAFSSFRCELSNEKLLLDAVENNRTRENLKRLLEREHIDLYELVMDGMSAFRGIHQIVRQTKCFARDFCQSSLYLQKLSELTRKVGLDHYKLLKDSEVLHSGKVYFYLAQQKLAEEIKAKFPSHAVYPADKIYPMVAQRAFVERYQKAYPMQTWYKHSDANVREYEALLKDFSLDGVVLPTGLEGIELLMSELDSIASKCGKIRSCIGDGAKV